MNVREFCAAKLRGHPIAEADIEAVLDEAGRSNSSLPLCYLENVDECSDARLVSIYRIVFTVAQTYMICGLPEPSAEMAAQSALPMDAAKAVSPGLLTPWNT